MTAYLFLPNNTDPPFQTVVHFPSAIPFFTPSSQHLQLSEVNFFMRSGRAVLFPVYKGTYERIIPNLLYGGPQVVASRTAAADRPRERWADTSASTTAFVLA